MGGKANQSEVHSGEGRISMQLKISKYIDDHASDMIAALSSLVAVPSVRGAAESGMPYGKEPARALSVMLNLAEKCGFSVKNHENYVGTIDFDPTKETTLGVLCHLDVVPAGKGWTNPPYTLTLSGGKLYGRGSADDKGPAVAVLFAMRALKECGYELSGNVRFLVGCDEENGSSDLAYYRKKESLPPRVFTPDGSFPVIHLEKGMIRGKVIKKIQSDGVKTIVSASGGVAVNAVPDRAYAVLRGFSEDELAAAKLSLPAGIDAAFEAENGTVKVTVMGKSEHASTPEDGKNAVCALFAFLASLPCDDGSAAFFAELSKTFRFGETDGTSLGIRASDEKSGALTFVFSVFSFEKGMFEGRFDIRFPISQTSGKLRTKLEKALTKAGLKIDEWTASEPHYVDENSDFVQTLLSVYTELTRKKGYCMAIGGGTYVHDIAGGVAFGAEFPGVESRMHGADEFISLEDMLLSSKIFAEAILRLCR